MNRLLHIDFRALGANTHMHDINAQRTEIHAQTGLSAHLFSSPLYPIYSIGPLCLVSSPRVTPVI